MLRSGLSGHSDVLPIPVGIVGVSPWDLLLLDDEDGLESSISHLLEAHEHAHESKSNEQVRAILNSSGFVLNILLGLGNLLI